MTTEHAPRLTSYANCAGCAAKVSAQDLAQVLRHLPPQDDPRLLVDTRHFDDAGVARLTEDLALVQTVDFFPPVVDDPWWYGRIAAANALSDLYAMGARPFSVLNVLAFNTDELPLAMMTEILKGGADATREAGALILGGHSINDTGVKFGLACTGTLRPGEELTNAAVRAGDVLFLTKPLGVGSLLTAAKKDRLDAGLLPAALESMGRLNAAAAEAARGAGVRAATDVTGFGLAGHAHECAAASGVDLHLFAESLPWLDGALDCGARGFVSGSSRRTRAYLGERFAVEAEVASPLPELVADSETSGGLLLAVGRHGADRLAAELESRGVPAVRVGCAEVPRQATPRVVLRAGAAE